MRGHEAGVGRLVAWPKKNVGRVKPAEQHPRLTRRCYRNLATVIRRNGPRPPGALRFADLQALILAFRPVIARSEATKQSRFFSPRKNKIASSQRTLLAMTGRDGIMPKSAWLFPAGNALLERRTNTGWPKAIASQPCRPNNKLANPSNPP